MVVHGRSAAEVASLAKRAWIALALTPVGLALGMVIGEGIYSMQGYDTSTTDAPLSVKALASIPALIVIMLPPLMMSGRGQPWESTRLHGHFWRTLMGTTSMGLGFYAEIGRAHV